MKTKTSEVEMIEHIVNEQCELRLKCIEALIKRCKFTVEQVSIYAEIDSSTIYRYMEHRSHMRMDKFFYLFVSLKKYMNDNGISIDEELQDIIRQTNISNITL